MMSCHEIWKLRTKQNTKLQLHLLRTAITSTEAHAGPYDVFTATAKPRLGLSCHPSQATRSLPYYMKNLEVEGRPAWTLQSASSLVNRLSKTAMLHLTLATSLLTAHQQIARAPGLWSPSVQVVLIATDRPSGRLAHYPWAEHVTRCFHQGITATPSADGASRGAGCGKQLTSRRSESMKVSQAGIPWSSQSRRFSNGGQVGHPTLQHTNSVKLIRRCLISLSSLLWCVN